MDLPDDLKPPADPVVMPAGVYTPISVHAISAVRRVRE
jgi:hypothetical protein